MTRATPIVTTTTTAVKVVMIRRKFVMMIYVHYNKMKLKRATCKLVKCLHPSDLLNLLPITNEKRFYHHYSQTTDIMDFSVRLSTS